MLRSVLKKPIYLVGLALVLSLSGFMHKSDRPKIGVIYVVHGGGGDKTDAIQATLWESAIQIFSSDPNNPIYKRVVWNPEAWPRITGFGDGQRYSNIASQIKKYTFQNEKVGLDPARDITVGQWKRMSKTLNKMEKDLGVDFITDWSSWITSYKDIKHLPWPRYIYNPKVPGGVKMTYCGSEADGGKGRKKQWPGCDEDRYDVDAPAERLIKKGAEAIVMIDMTTSGVRFVKSYEVVERTKAVVAAYNEENGTDIPVHWVNDPTDLMAESHPVEPEGWTRTLEAPIRDVKVPLEGRPNPVSSDPEFGAMMVDGITSQFNPDVAVEDTAVFIINHTISRHNQTFDPKMNDTIILNDNIKAEILRRHPEIDPDNVIGGWMGVKQLNPNIPEEAGETARLERTRLMRAENLGHGYLYETDFEMPGGDWKWRYWDGLEYLKDRGAKHIVIIFSQIVTHSVLDMVEVSNQIGKELGYKTWMYWEEGDYDKYPNDGHPFADYWYILADTQCRPIGNDDPNAELVDCCFTMGGCEGTDQPYPPLRQTPIDQAMPDKDPHVVYDIPAYGHLGYDPANGKPSDDRPVQDQYTGTWSMWDPLNTDPRLGDFLAKHVVMFVEEEIL